VNFQAGGHVRNGPITYEKKVWWGACEAFPVAAPAFEPFPQPLPSLTPEISPVQSTTATRFRKLCPHPLITTNSPWIPTSIFNRVAFIQGSRRNCRVIDNFNARVSQDFSTYRGLAEGLPSCDLRPQLCSFRVVPAGIQGSSLDNRPKVVVTCYPQCHRCVNRQ
jgi:hypothetical protein